MCRYAVRLALAAFVVLFAACDSNEDGNRNLDGTWIGLGSSGSGQVQLTLLLTDNGGTVTGAATIVTNQTFSNLNVSGTFDDPNLDIDITGGPSSATYDARMADNGETITGSLTGLGNPITIAVKRQ